MPPVVWDSPINMGTLGFKRTWFNRNTFLWQTFHKLWILLTRVIEFGTLTEGLAVNWKRYNLSMLQLEQVNCCLLGEKKNSVFVDCLLDISLALCSTQTNIPTENYLNNKTTKLLENSNICRDRLRARFLKVNCKNFICSIDTSIPFLSGLLNPPGSKGNSNGFPLWVDQDKQQGFLLPKRHFLCSGGNSSHNYNDEVVWVPNPDKLHITLRQEMDKTPCLNRTD